MRDLKVRFWDGYEYTYLESHKDHGIYRCGSFEDMQLFTGLHDRRGIPIYEGDVISGRFEGVNQVVSVDMGHGLRFMCERDQLCKCDAVYGEVIGNIHENPELLASK